MFHTLSRLPHIRLIGAAAVVAIATVQFIWLGSEPHIAGSVGADVLGWVMMMASAAALAVAVHCAGGSRRASWAVAAIYALLPGIELIYATDLTAALRTSAAAIVIVLLAANRRRGLRLTLAALLTAALLGSYGRDPEMYRFNLAFELGAIRPHHASSVAQAAEISRLYGRAYCANGTPADLYIILPEKPDPTLLPPTEMARIAELALRRRDGQILRHLARQMQWLMLQDRILPRSARSGWAGWADQTRVSFGMVIIFLAVAAVWFIRARRRIPCKLAVWWGWGLALGCIAGTWLAYTQGWTLAAAPVWPTLFFIVYLMVRRLKPSKPDLI